jgi:hypothetical protein
MVNMSEVTLEAIAGLLKEELDPIKIDLVEVKQTVTQHSSALFELSKDVKELKEEVILNNRKFDKHEQAITFTVDKVGIAPEIKRVIEA